jgi:hypothetical protein
MPITGTGSHKWKLPMPITVDVTIVAQFTINNAENPLCHIQQLN